MSAAMEISAQERNKSVTAVDPNADVVAMTPMQMAFQLIQGGADLGSVKEMLAMSRELAADEARRAFDAALSAAKAEIPPILKNRLVDFTGKTNIRTYYRHEDMGEIARTVDPILARHGLSYRFRTEQQDGGAIRVVCVVGHRDGHSEENALSAGRDESGNKNNIQAVGSTITYLQRYTLKAALGLAASNDDDGRASGGDDDGDPGPISEDQVAEIEQAMDAAAKATSVKIEVYRKNFLGYVKAASVPSIAARDFKKALDAIKSTMPK